MVGKQGRGQHISRSFLLFPPTDIIFFVWLFWNVLKFVSIVTICQSSVSTMIMDFMDMKTLYSCPLSWGFWEFHNCIVYKLSRLGGGADADIWHNTPSRWRARVTSQCPPPGSAEEPEDYLLSPAPVLPWPWPGHQPALTRTRHMAECKLGTTYSRGWAAAVVVEGSIYAVRCLQQFFTDSDYFGFYKFWWILIVDGSRIDLEFTLVIFS